MTTIDSVKTPGTSAEVDPAFLALRVSQRPLEHGAGGHFRVYGLATSVKPGASGVQAAFRWTDTTKFAVIYRVNAIVTVTSAVTPQEVDPITLSVVRGYTARDLTNATSILPSGSSNKMRTSMGSSLVTNLDVTNAAAGMSGGMGTKDANPIGMLAVNGIGAVGTAAQGDLFALSSPAMHPIVLGPNEGLNLLWGATVLVSGAVQVAVGFEWAEVPVF